LKLPLNPILIDKKTAIEHLSRIPEAFKRIFQIGADECASITRRTNSINTMSMKVTTMPNPFYTSVTIEVTCEQNKQIIVRMFDEGGKIIKLLSWYIVKGSNITSINELSVLDNGHYFIEIIDNDGNLLFNTKLSKQ